MLLSYILQSFPETHFQHKFKCNQSHRYYHHSNQRYTTHIWAKSILSYLHSCQQFLSWDYSLLIKFIRSWLAAASRSVGDTALSYPRAATLDNIDRRRAAQQQQRGPAQNPRTQGSYSRRTSQAEQSLPTLHSQPERGTSRVASSQSVTSSEQRPTDWPEPLAFPPAQAQQQLLTSNLRNVQTGITSQQVAVRPAQQRYSVTCNGPVRTANSSSGWLLKCCPSDSRILVLFHRQHSTPKCSQTIKVSAKVSEDSRGIDGQRLSGSP